MAAMFTSDFEDSINVSVFEQSSPESLRARALSPPAHNLSRSTSNNPTLNYETEDDYFGHVQVKQCNSSRSSISSFPSSVIHTFPVTDNEEINSRTPSRSQLLSNGRNGPAYKASSNSYLAAFRHPNSVRALQLESEYADSDSHSIARSSRHRKSPKFSHFSPRSPGSTQSSPTKRSSRPGTPQHQRSNSKLKKEFPLVLLHCTLLQPAATTRGSSVSEEILEAVLPEEYRKRWRTLQDKVVKNTEVKQRGILIAHPQDEYDLLEERLLEALELERPRIRKGHYIGTSKSDSDSGFESSSQNGTDDGSESDERNGRSAKDKCPDCGKGVSRKTEQDRTWEVKIFAANGLMRSGAWTAAWEQMEKIDVEVAVWMPEDVRFEVEERLKALQAMEEAERPVEEPIDPPKKERTRSNTARLRHDERMREIYGEPEKPRTQEEIDGLAEPRKTEHSTASIQTPDAQGDVEMKSHLSPPAPDFVSMHLPQHEIPSQPDFLTFMKYHFRMILHDQRNLAIVLLSTLVLFFSVQNLDVGSKSPSQPPEAVQSMSMSMPIDSAAQIPVIGMETPIVSYITTTVLITPSSFPHVIPPGEETYEPQSEPHVEDDAAILEKVSSKPLTNTAVVESTTETSRAEPERDLEAETAQTVLPFDDEPLQPDLSPMVFEVEENARIEESTDGDHSDTSHDIELDHQVVINTNSPSQYKSPSNSEEWVETFTPPDEVGQLETPDERFAETQTINISINSAFAPFANADGPSIEDEPATDSTNIKTPTPESPFTYPDAPKTSAHHPKDNTPLVCPSDPFQVFFTTHVCMNMDTEQEQRQEQDPTERMINERY